MGVVVGEDGITSKCMAEEEGGEAVAAAVVAAVVAVEVIAQMNFGGRLNNSTTKALQPSQRTHRWTIPHFQPNSAEEDRGSLVTSTASGPLCGASMVRATRRTMIF